MSTFKARYTILLIITLLLTLVRVADANPTGHPTYHDLDWSWELLESIGGDLAHAIGYDQLNLLSNPACLNTNYSPQPELGNNYGRFTSLHVSQGPSQVLATPRAQSGWAPIVDSADAPGTDAIYNDATVTRQPASAMSVESSAMFSERPCAPRDSPFAELEMYHFSQEDLPNTVLPRTQEPGQMTQPHAGIPILQRSTHDLRLSCPTVPLGGTDNRHRYIDSCGTAQPGMQPNMPMSVSFGRHMPETFPIRHVFPAPGGSPLLDNVARQTREVGCLSASMHGREGKLPASHEDSMQAPVDFLSAERCAISEHDRLESLSPSSASTAGSSSSRPVTSRHSHCRHRVADSYASRRHVCSCCAKRFQYRKDLIRHWQTHLPNRTRFYCPVPTCKYSSKGFGRQDHLDRHKLSQHGASCTGMECG